MYYKIQRVISFTKNIARPIGYLLLLILFCTSIGIVANYFKLGGIGHICEVIEHKIKYQNDTEHTQQGCLTWLYDYRPWRYCYGWTTPDKVNELFVKYDVYSLHRCKRKDDALILIPPDRIKKILTQGFYDGLFIVYMLLLLYATTRGDNNNDG